MIEQATEKDFPLIAATWELSVRATHDFLPEDYLQRIKTLLPSFLPSMPVYIYRNDVADLAGFLGVDDGKIEMLFIHPDYMGKGIGRKLMHYALHELGATRVDVNEHNARATAFYKYMGFEVISRSELDGLGKPFPILHMSLPAEKYKAI